MSISKEEENLIRARKVIDDEVLRRLRVYFKQTWNGQKDASQAAWSDCGNDGQALLKKLQNEKRNIFGDTKTRIESGDTEQWDVTCLYEAIVLLIKGKSNKKKKSAVEVNALKAITTLKDQRNVAFHRHHGELSDTERHDFFKKIRDAYSTLGWPVDDVNNIETAVIETEEMKRLKSQLESEKRKGKYLFSEQNRIPRLESISCALKIFRAQAHCHELPRKVQSKV